MMKIENQRNGTEQVLKPYGRIDTSTAPALAEAIDLDGVAKIVFDLTEIDYVSSAGLRIFLSTHQKMTAAGGEMVIRGVRPIVMEIFDIAGFSDEFHFENGTAVR